MKDLRVKPLALAIMAMTSSAPLLAQDDEVDQDETTIEEVRVIGVRASELRSRELERDKSSFTSIISQDDAGNFADQNVAESLQRLPGLTTIKNEGEGRFVSVRGLGPGFVSVNMNGSELATAGDDTRAFALDAIPADMLGSIEVYKSLTPNQDLNSIAGVVNVNTISAFDRKSDSMKLNVQTNQQSYDDDLSPKLSFSGNNLFADETIGLGYALSWEKRNSVTYINEHHATSNPRAVSANGVDGLIPFRYEAKQEDAERTRVAASMTLEYRPDEDNRYKFDISRTEFEDIDIALREYHRWGQASTSEVVYVDPANRLFGLYGTDLQHQFFIQEGDSVTTALSFTGEHTIGAWDLDYTFAASDSSWDKPGGRRTQFRVRELPMIGTYGPNYFNSVVVSPEVLTSLSGNTDVAGGAYGFGYLPGERVQSGMEFDNLFIEDSFRDDEIQQVKVNLRHSFDDGEIKYVQFGVATKMRERTRDKDRWSIVPSDYSVSFCELSIDPEACSDWTFGSGALLGEFSTFTPDHPDIQYDFETYEEAERIIAVTAPLAYNSDQTAVNIDSTRDDHWLQEDSSSVYAMLEWEPFANASVITGVKYETTTFESQGNFSIRNDREDDPDLGTQGDLVVALPQAKNSYSDVLPSVHFRWEPRDDLLYRAAIWTSFTRPGFDQARTYGSIANRIEFCIVDDSEYSIVPDSGCGEAREFQHPLNGTLAFDDVLDGNFYVSPALTLEIGNPTLRAMTSTNFDTSLGWYAGDDLYLQAAFFYKDISDFILPVRSGAALSFDEFPFSVPLEDIRGVIPIRDGETYNNIVYSVNGDSADVYGIELSLAKNFESGFFVSGNMTLMNSSANLGEQFDFAEIPLPEQADEIANLTVGWENDEFSVRLSSNYRSEVFKQYGDDVFDIYADNTFGLDFKASWIINDMFNVYFDAVNLTEDTSLQYFTGNSVSNGKIMYQTEDFGTSWQLGVNVTLF